MLEFDFKRILIIGCPGSGKSFFARKLRDILCLPLFYLDMIWHKPDKTNISREEFDLKLDEILNKDEWIIDGNYNRTLGKRFEKCDCVIWFDIPTEICIKSALERVGIEREDMPWNDSIDDDFLDYIRSFKSEQCPAIEKLLCEFSDIKVIKFHSREESERFLFDLGETNNNDK